MILRFGLFCLVAFSVFLVGSGEAFDFGPAVAYWLFDEDGGDEAIDSSENGHNGALGAGIKWTEGKFGTALEFSGGGFVTVPTHDQLTLTDFTLMAWVNIPNQLAGWQAVVYKGCPPWPNRNYLMGIMDGFVHWATVALGGNPEVWFNTTGIVADGDWHHIAITSDNKMGKSYIDGELDTEQAADYVPMESTCDVTIGSQGYVGSIDEVLIANQVYSEDDIKDAMEQGLEMLTPVSALGKLTSTWGAIRSGTMD